MNNDPRKKTLHPTADELAKALIDRNQWLARGMELDIPPEELMELDKSKWSERLVNRYKHGLAFQRIAQIGSALSWTYGTPEGVGALHDIKQATHAAFIRHLEGGPFPRRGEWRDLCVWDSINVFMQQFGDFGPNNRTEFEFAGHLKEQAPTLTDHQIMLGNSIQTWAQKGLRERDVYPDRFQTW